MPKFAIHGFIRHALALRAVIPGGTGQVTSVDQLPWGRKSTLEKVEVLTTVAGAGAGANRTINVRKGSATGTVVATGTLTLANQTLGAVLALTVTASAADFDDADKLTVEFPTAGAVAFTAGDISLVCTFRERPQIKG